MCDGALIIISGLRSKPPACQVPLTLMLTRVYCVSGTAPAVQHQTAATLCAACAHDLQPAQLASAKLPSSQVISGNRPAGHVLLQRHKVALQLPQLLSGGEQDRQVPLAAGPGQGRSVGGVKRVRWVIWEGVSRPGLPGTLCGLVWAGKKCGRCGVESVGGRVGDGCGNAACKS